jgi:UDP-2,3-diacylglucosamine pyrophosphatase LpxH
VADGHADSFTWCTAGPWWRDEQNNLYVHGDQLNPRDRRYLLFRRLTKNRLTRILLGHLPRGPQLCERLKRALRQTNLEHRRQIPAAAIRAFAERMFAAGCGTIFLGHFHQAHRFENDKAATLYVLPAWYQKAEITLVSATGASARNIAWQSL